MRINSNYIHLNEKIGIRLYGASDPLIKLVCFSPIGGNSNHFSRMARHLPPGWQLCAVDLPGHGQARGRLMVHFDSIVSLYLEHLKPFFMGESYIFGHSLGGLIGYVLTQKLERGVNFAGIFISSCAPPHRVVEDIANNAHEEISEQEISDYLQSIDPGFRRLEKSFFFVYLKPVFKADYKVFRSFNFVQKEKINTPLYIIYSPNDKMVDPEELKEWGHFGHMVQFIEVPGRHDNIITHADIIMNEIKAHIDSNTRSTK